MVRPLVATVPADHLLEFVPAIAKAALHSANGVISQSNVDLSTCRGYTCADLVALIKGV